MGIRPFTSSSGPFPLASPVPLPGPAMAPAAGCGCGCGGSRGLLRASCRLRPCLLFDLRVGRGVGCLCAQACGQRGWARTEKEPGVRWSICGCNLLRSHLNRTTHPSNRRPASAQPSYHSSAPLTLPVCRPGFALRRASDGPSPRPWGDRVETTTPTETLPAAGLPRSTGLVGGMGRSGACVGRLAT